MYDHEADLASIIAAKRALGDCVDELEKIMKISDRTKQEVDWLRRLNSLLVVSVGSLTEPMTRALGSLHESGTLQLINEHKASLLDIISATEGQQAFLEAEAKIPGLSLEMFKQELPAITDSRHVLLSNDISQISLIYANGFKLYSDALITELVKASDDQTPWYEEKLPKLMELLKAIFSLAGGLGFIVFDIGLGSKGKNAWTMLFAALSIMLGIIWMLLACRRIFKAMIDLVDP